MTISSIGVIKIKTPNQEPSIMRVSTWSSQTYPGYKTRAKVSRETLSGSEPMNSLLTHLHLVLTIRVALRWNGQWLMNRIYLLEMETSSTNLGVDTTSSQIRVCSHYKGSVMWRERLKTYLPSMMMNSTQICSPTHSNLRVVVVDTPNQGIQATGPN
jgi:hypothetical protein